MVFRQTQAAGTEDAAVQETITDSRGFTSSLITYVDTAPSADAPASPTDKKVQTDYIYNERGMVTRETDNAGNFTKYSYDAMDRPITSENYDADGNLLSWNFIYYNQNGEVSWMDGPRYDPEDYVFRDYDGAGRLIAEVRWRSRAKSDGQASRLFREVFRSPCRDLLLR